MADTFTEALIDAVRQYPVIYNVSEPDYKDLDKKNEAWQEISSNLQHDCDALKKRWRSLRDCYSKYKRTLRTTTGQAAAKYKKWPWAGQMAFLDTATALRPTSSNVISTTPTALTSTASASIAITSPDTEVTNETVSDQENVIPADNSNIGHRKRRPKPADPACTIVNYLKDRNENRVPKSAIDLLFRSYAETFKKYTPLTQARLKIDMAKLFAEAEIHEIEQRETPSYRYSSAYSNISTESPSAQSYIATPSPQPEDLSSSILQQSSERNELNFELLNFQTPDSAAHQVNIQQQNSAIAALPSLQPQYLNRTLLGTDNNEADESVILDL